jgi:hypothetical protein
MLSTKHKLLIGTALLADTVSRTCNLLRIVWCSAMLVAIIITAWRDDYVDHINKWPAALFTSVVLATKLVRWLRIEF